MITAVTTEDWTAFLSTVNSEDFIVQPGTAQAQNLPGVQMSEDAAVVAAVNMHENDFLLASCRVSCSFNDLFVPETHHRIWSVLRID